jgi:hypothetical protein
LQMPPPPAPAPPDAALAAKPSAAPVQKNSARVAILGLLIAGAITGGWLYAKYHKQKNSVEASPPITTPDRQVKAPRNSRPITGPDPDAPRPVADNPSPASKGSPTKGKPAKDRP